MTIDLLMGFAAGVLIGIGLTQYRVSRLKNTAATDTLTGLYNRALLNKTLGRLLAGARRDKQSLSLMMIDLNHFKEANDRFGHPFGDQVLKAAAEAMVVSLRQSDFIFRYGGDEFLIILPHTTSVGAQRVAKKIKRNLDEIILKTPKGHDFQDIAASIGIASYPEHAEVDTVLLVAADEAVYLAKDKKSHIEVAKIEA